MFTIKNSKIAIKNKTAIMFFPFMLITGNEKTDEEDYMYKIYKKQYTDTFGIGCFIAIALLFFILGLSGASIYLICLAMIPIVLYDFWFFIELLFKKFKISDVSFVKQAIDFGPDWIKPCERRREYVSMSWLKYI